MVNHCLPLKPDDLQPAHLQSILSDYRKTKDFDDFDPTYFRLNNYVIQPQPEKNWLYLAEFYNKLVRHKENFFGIKIRQLFTSAFALPNNYFDKVINRSAYVVSALLKRNINKYYEGTRSYIKGKKVCLKKINPEDISNSHIRSLGEAYLELYGETPQVFLRFFKIHTNQRFAKQMLEANFKTARERWVFLANTYLKLPNNNGMMAEQIRGFFRNAFPHDYELDNWHFYQSTTRIAEYMHAIIEERYPKIHLLDIANDISQQVSDKVNEVKTNVASNIVKAALGM